METTTLDEVLQEDATALQEVLTDLIRVYRFRDRDAVWCYDISVGQSHALDRLQRLGFQAFGTPVPKKRRHPSRIDDLHRIPRGAPGHTLTEPVGIRK